MTAEGGNRVFADDGRALLLGKTLKSGGAGSIHRIAENPELVAKIYHPQIDHLLYERKVTAMLSLVPDLPDITEGGPREVQIAWPRFLLRDRQRRFVGFAMPVLDFAASVELECVLQERQARAQGLPTGLGAKMTLAANLASLIAEVHRQGHSVVDLKPVNLRFYRRSLHIAMLDCDGFSIRGHGERFPASEFTPEYFAPEFQRQGLAAGGDQASSEESQDRFALAVVIFQLLNFGIHPFSGRPASDRIPTDVPGRIAEHCYAYGLRPSPAMAPNPASGHTAMPTELRLLFDRAFTALGMSRPSADEWFGHLRAYGRRSTRLLVACRANAHHQHFAGFPCAACARAGLLSRAASVVRPPAVMRPPVWSAPAWTVRRAAPAVFATAVSPPPSASSFKPKPSVLPTFVISGLLFVLLRLAPTWCSETERSPISATEAQSWGNSWHTERATEKAPPATTLEEVLSAAKNFGKDEIEQQLSRLPSNQDGQQEEKCRTALAGWRDKVKWTKDDPAYARDGYFSEQADYAQTLYMTNEEQQRDPCGGLSVLVPRILRAEELCMRRLDSPGAYPGIGEAECRKNRVLEASVDTIESALLYVQARDSLVWEGMGQAFLLNDDYQNAQAAYVISSLLAHTHEDPYVPFDDEPGLSKIIDERWLRKRAEILNARAAAVVHEWNGEPAPKKLDGLLRAHWPDEPPSKKPLHRLPRQ